MPSINTSDTLNESSRNFKDYPLNLIDSKITHTTLEEYKRRLENSKDGLFSADSLPMEFVESWDGDQDPQEIKVTDLARHTGSNRKDPKSRFIFIEAENSRRPLTCSIDQLRQALTYHQVMPWFLDLLFSFCPQITPGSVYGQEDKLLEASDQRFEVKNRGRSGSILQHCFSLRTAQRPESNDEETWPIRQAAVYHSFDIVTGRSVFITAADESFSQRLRGMLSYSTSLFTGGPNSGPTPTSIATSFGATLATQLECLRWCEDSWRDCIRFLEIKMSENEKWTVSKPTPSKRDGERFPLPHRCAEPQDLGYGDLERLAAIADRMEECRLAIQLNEIVMESIVRHYNDLLSTSEVINALNGEHCSQIARFFEQMSCIRTNLRAQQLRLETLARAAQNRRTMIQMTLSMQESDRRMRSITEQISQEAPSMHIITLMTLVFLPGTFGAMFMARTWFDNTDGSPLPPQAHPPASTVPVSRDTFDRWKVFLSSAAGITTLMILVMAICILRGLRKTSQKRETMMENAAEGHPQHFGSGKDQFELPLSTSRYMD